MSGHRLWVEQMGVETAQHRKQRARDHADRAQQRYLELRAEGWSEGYARDKSKWHRDRAEGQRKRIERVLECGANVVLVQCNACGRVHERRDGCRIGLLCVPCRKEIVAAKRAAFLPSRDDVLDHAQARGLLNSWRRGGAWSEKFLTLTAPHIGELGFREPVRRLRSALPRFLRRMNDHMESITAPSWEFYRTFEWTPGMDALGHPHFHFWLFCPYLHHELPREWWRRSLLEPGYRFDDIPGPIIDIRAVHNGEEAARELVKYMTKDLDATGSKIPPRVFAEVYKELDGTRTTQGSRGFVKRGSRKAACECGASQWTRTIAKRNPNPGEEPR